MRFISHQITPLVINSLRGGHTHTHILTICTGSILWNRVRTDSRLVRAWFKNDPKKEPTAITMRGKQKRLLISDCKGIMKFLSCQVKIVPFDKHNWQPRRQINILRMLKNVTAKGIQLQTKGCKQNIIHCIEMLLMVSLGNKNQIFINSWLQREPALIASKRISEACQDAAYIKSADVTGGSTLRLPKWTRREIIYYSNELISQPNIAGRKDDKRVVFSFANKIQHIKTTH